MRNYVKLLRTPWNNIFYIRPFDYRNQEEWIPSKSQINIAAWPSLHNWKYKCIGCGKNVGKRYEQKTHKLIDNDQRKKMQCFIYKRKLHHVSCNITPAPVAIYLNKFNRLLLVDKLFVGCTNVVCCNFNLTNLISPFFDSYISITPAKGQCFFGVLSTHNAIINTYCLL